MCSIPYKLTNTHSNRFSSLLFSCSYHRYSFPSSLRSVFLQSLLVLFFMLQPNNSVSFTFIIHHHPQKHTQFIRFLQILTTSLFGLSKWPSKGARVKPVLRANTGDENARLNVFWHHTSRQTRLTCFGTCIGCLELVILLRFSNHLIHLNRQKPWPPSFTKLRWEICSLSMDAVRSSTFISLRYDRLRKSSTPSMHR